MPHNETFIPPLLLLTATHAIGLVILLESKARYPEYKDAKKDIVPGMNL